MVRAMCGVQLKDRKRSMDFMLGLNETIDQLAIANSVRWYDHVLRREDGHILRRALDFEVEGQRMKGRLKRTWKKQVEEGSVKVGLRRSTLPFKVECRRKKDCCWVEVNLVSLTCLENYQILDIFSLYLLLCKHA